MIPEAKQLFESVKTNHANCYVVAKRIEDLLPKLAEDMNETVDTAYALKECFDLAEDTLKTLRAIKGLIDRLACTMMVRDNIVAGYETEYCLCTAKCKVSISIPSRSKNPEKFLEIMRSVGVPENLLGDDETPECCRLHYPGIVEKVSKMLAAGEPLPLAFQEIPQYTEYKVRITPRKGVTE